MKNKYENNESNKIVEQPKDIALQEGDARTEHKRQKSKKIACNRNIRKIFLAVGAILFVSGCAATIYLASPHEELQQIPISSANIKAETSYRVHLKPNSLYDEEWMGEELLYSSLLTDSIEMEFKADAALSKEMKMMSDYKITAVLEGYQAQGDSKVPIYERRYPLAEGSTRDELKKYEMINDKVHIDPTRYRNLALQAEEVLGGQTMKDFYILFEGRFMIDSQENTFSQKVTVPIGNEFFYSIAKSEPSGEENSITEEATVTVTPPLTDYLAYAAAAAAGFLICMTAAFGTRAQNEEELRTASLKKVMRKYASRMICLESLPDTRDKMILRLSNMDSMVALAEELRAPILYCLGEDSLPRDGRFCVMGEEYVYLLEFPRPQSLPDITLSA